MITAGASWTGADETRAKSAGVPSLLSGDFDCPDPVQEALPRRNDLAADFASAAGMLMGNARACLSTEVALTSVSADGHK